MDIRKFFIKKPRLRLEIDDEPDIHVHHANDITVQTTLSAANLATAPPRAQADDLVRLGEPIKQIHLKNYPKQKNNRSFHAEWFKKFKWLEYSAQMDVAFCYACRQFQPLATKETAYTETGYKNWKNAMDPKNGFPKHENSETHITSMTMWNEKLYRQSSATSISTLVSQNVLEKHRYYIKSIAEVVQFLAVNELALRGTYEAEEHIERGLFVNLFKYTLKKDSTLAECAQHIPKNAVYTSPEIQNEIIEILAEIVRENVVNDVKNADVPWFTLLEDGTRDKNNRENVSIGIRYVKDGKVFESLLGIYTTKKMDAKTFTEMTLKILKDSNIDQSRLLSQCYDGASVMSGKKGGVSALIQKALNRRIPYVHCYNHRLHLVVVKMVSEIPVLKHFFDQCILLHAFFQHGTVAALYEGKTIVRVLEQRWSGHLAIVNVILSNYEEIIKTLDIIMKHEKFSGGDVAKSRGIKSVMLELKFRFALCLMKKILGILEPADAVLQARSSSLKDAVLIIKSVKRQISIMKTAKAFSEILNEAKNILGNNEDKVGSSKRVGKAPANMKDYIVSEKLPIYSNTDNVPSQFERVYYEVIDLVTTQLEERFCDNDELLNCISSIEEFDFDKIQYLKQLGITIPSREELAVVKDFMSKRSEANVFQELYKQREVFKKCYEMFASTATIGCSTATCESTFSTLTAVNLPQRISMEYQRMADLVFIAFEKKKAEDIDFNLFLRKFNDRRNRKLQLF